MTNEAATYRIDLPDYALLALDILERNGHESWCVGGFVRDAIRGHAGNDIDIATSARWQETKSLFESLGFASFETGTKHGTISILINSHILEITTFRREGAYSDRRHPDSVEFVHDIAVDLARRDFTMNAIAYHPERGLFDPYEGVRDIQNASIRSVGEARLRFSEDALRILRACRFASQLGFSIEETTKVAMFELRSSLDSIAVERIQRELDAFFCGSHIHDALLSYVEIIAEIIPEILPMEGFDQKTPYHIYDVLEHTAYCMQYCSPTPLVRWAAFFHDIGKPQTFFTDEKGIGHFYGHAKVSVDIARATMTRLKLPRKFSHGVLLLIKHHDDDIPAQPKSVKRMLQKLDGSPDLFFALCDLKKGDALAQAPRCHERVEHINELESILDTILAEQEAFTLSHLAIDGSDLIALGCTPGPQIGLILEKTLEAVIRGDSPNEKLSLISYAKQYLSDS